MEDSPRYAADAYWIDLELINILSEFDYPVFTEAELRDLLSTANLISAPGPLTSRRWTVRNL